MKNFRKVLSKTVALLYFADTYGSAIRGHRIKRGVAKLLEKFIKDNTYGFAIRKPLRKVYQTTGMQSIPGHRIKRGVAL